VEPSSEQPPRRYTATIASGGSLAGVVEVVAAIQRIGFALAAVLFVLGALPVALAVAFSSVGIAATLRVSRAVSRALASKTPSTISVENGALVLDGGPKGTRVVPLAKLRTGRVLRAGSGRARLVVRGRWGQSIVAHFDDAADARALLRDLKLSARDTPATFSFFFGLRVTVGADGILMNWPLLRRRRFVPYSKIVAMAPSPGMIVFRLAGGDRYEIMTTTSGRSIALEQHDALVERIEDACSAYRADNVEPPLAALGRGGRSALGWVKDLRALSEASGVGYRAATLPSDALWNVALDPAATEEMRIGAGLALRGALDEQGRARLRVAAEASASPKVRVVLEGAAEGMDDERLGESIGEVGATRSR
jgi:hypothetical protein